MKLFLALLKQLLPKHRLSAVVGVPLVQRINLRWPQEALQVLCQMKLVWAAQSNKITRLRPADRPYTMPDRFAVMAG
jgi:hypothetical protein